MTPKTLVKFGLAPMAMVCQAFLGTTVLAHGVEISGEAVCEADVPTINFTATSWSPDAIIGENPDILIYVNGFNVASGAFVYPGNSFSDSTAAPAGDSAALAAFVNAPWADGFEGGQTAYATVPLDVTCPTGFGQGRFTGGGHQVRVGEARVTRGLTLHCDLLLSNNLEINWGGNQFHMEEHMTTVECSDDPDIVQAPPEAPLDTMIGVGAGRYNGMDGYTVEFTLVDGGEPGAGVDYAALKVYETANSANVVLDVPLQPISGGNLQAHYDQPHK